MIGKKEHVDVKLYTGEMHDRDDLATEKSEKALWSEMKTEFKSFLENAVITKQEIQFYILFRRLGFSGAPFHSTVLLQPTTSCLVNLTG